MRWIIAAPGPSLTLADCMSASKYGQFMAVNSAVFMAPFAGYLFAGDSEWWRLHNPFLDWYAGNRFTVCPDSPQYGACRMPRVGKPDGLGVFGNNSGVQAISLAFWLGASEVILIGFDCKMDRGTHCHGDHPERLVDGTRGIGNPMNASQWIEEHARIAELFGDRIVNCTRDTALTCYRQTTLSRLIHGNRG